MKFQAHPDFMRRLVSIFPMILMAFSAATLTASTVGAQTRRETQSAPERPPSTPQDASATNLVAEANADYQISPGDVIEIIIEDAPELSRNYRVNATGNFEMQVLGRIQARRKTTEELARMISDQLRSQDYLKNPNVVVTIKQYNSQTFFIQGAINRPGVYQLEGKPSLLMMIGLAGGLMDNHGSTAFIIRKGKAPAENVVAASAPAGASDFVPASPEKRGNQEPDAGQELGGDYELLRVNLSALYKGQFTQNQLLEPGDIVNVPRSDVFFVAGEVAAPGSFALKEGTTLRQAISLAQGLTFKAKAGSGVIFREDPNNGSRQEMKVDIGAVMSGKKEDIVILANDVIIIPNSRTKSVGGALLMALGVNSSRVPIRY
jgi:polysaccharide biosynthesis/export protein